MVTEYRHGIDTIEVDDGIVPIETGPSNVIGLVGTAPDADPDLFPLNTPILIAGDPRQAVLLGKTGTIPDAIDAIFDQFGADVVVIRVEPGEDQNAALSAFVGSATTLTGVHALKKANPVLKLIPKLLIVPGYTQQRPTDGIDAVTVNAGGTGYTQANTTVTFSGVTGAEGKVIVSNGAIEAVVMTKKGWGAETPVATIVGDGTGAEVTAVIGTVANPVVAELIGIAQDMRAIVIADTPGTSYVDAVTYAGDFDSDRLWLVEGGVQVWDTTANAPAVQPVAARLAGKQAYMDQHFGFWYSASNQPLNGVIGVNRIIDWSFTSSTVEGQLLNKQAVAVVVHDAGFRVLGVRSPTKKAVWKFLPVRRTADMVYDAIEQAMREAIDKPINLGLIDWIEGSVNAYLRKLKAIGAILNGRAWLDPTLNPVEQLQNGELVIDFDLEPPAPLERLQFRAHRNAGYYTEVLDAYLQNAA